MLHGIEYTSTTDTVRYLVNFWRSRYLWNPLYLTRPKLTRMFISHMHNAPTEATGMCWLPPKTIKKEKKDCRRI